MNEGMSAPPPEAVKAAVPAIVEAPKLAQPAPAAEAAGSIPPALTNALNRETPATPSDTTTPPGESVQQTREVARGREALTEEQLRNEVGRAARAAAITSGGKLEREHTKARSGWENEDKKTRSKKAPEFSTDRGDQAMYFCTKLQTLGQPGKATSIGADELQPNSDTALRLTLVNGRWIAAAKDTDGAVAITQIDASVGEDGKPTYTCMINGVDAAMPIDVATLQDAQLLAEAEAISAKLSGSQKKIFDSHIAQLKDPNVALGPDATENTVKEAARASGLISADSVRSYVEKTMKPNEGETGDSAEELIQRRDELLKRLDGKLTVTSEDLAAVLNENLPIGDPKVKITDLKQRIEGAMFALKSIATSAQPNSEGIQKLNMEINHMQAELELYEKIDKIGGKSGVGTLTSDFYAGVENGTIPVEAVNAFEDALKSGDNPQLLTMMVEAMFTDEKKLEAARKMIGQKEFMALGGIGVLFLMLMSLAKGDEK